MKTKEIKVEWCENFIKALFKKNPRMTGIATDYFWDLAEQAGLYVKGTYGSPMSEALSNVAICYPVFNDDGEFLYRSFALK